MAAGNSGVNMEAAEWNLDTDLDMVEAEADLDKAKDLDKIKDKAEADKTKAHKVLKAKADLKSVIWVGASISNDRIWGSSNYGPRIDLFAPGEGITSATNTSDNAVKKDSGTSMASPDNNI